MPTFKQKSFLFAIWGILFGIKIGQTQLCPAKVSNGTVASSCARQPGTVCLFTCNSGFMPVAGVKSIKCGSTGNWTFTSDVCVGATVKCPTSISNGEVTSCAGNVGDVCSFTCSAGYTPESTVKNVMCVRDGRWTPENACVVQCTVTVNRGVVTSCLRRPGDVCNFTCDAGFRPASGVTDVICGSDGQWVRKDVCFEGKCSANFPNGSLPISCNLEFGTTCSYFCDDRFNKNPNISSIRCNENGQWNADIRLLCTKTKVTCPHNFPGGSWDNCQSRENETCAYNCFSGFHRNPRIQNATCGSDGAWNQNTEKLCRRKCEIGVINGFLNSSCTLEIGEACAFQCGFGFKKASDANTVTCQENGEWGPDEPCKEVLCPTIIPNGTVSATACDRRMYSNCPFTCNQGFDPNRKYKGNTVFCNIDGNWFDSAEPSCIERKGLCPNFFEHGKLADSCQFQADEICAFECEGGFEKNPNITRNITCTSSAEWDVDQSLLCKENDRGLIVTLTQRYPITNEYICTVPTAPDGTPNLDYIRSLVLSNDVNFVSVDGHYALRHAYVYDYNTNTIYRDSNFSIGISGNNTWTSLHRGLSKDYVKLSVDWISHNIYWTDPQYKWITVQSLLGNDTSMYRVLIHENLEGPYALALDPMEALLFWSDIGTFTKIEVSSLSGRNRKSLIYSNLVMPYSLAADFMTRRLYLIDAGRDVVETATYEGRDRKLLLRETYGNFFDIAIYKDYLYVTDTYTDILYFFNKTNGKELHESLSRSSKTYYGVAVFHPDAQPTSATAHCVNYGCEQICVTEKDGATCLCKDGYSLNQDMKTCSLNNTYFHRGLMFSNESSICIVDIRVVTHFSYDPKCVLKTNGTKYMILDTDQRQVIIANDTAIYWARVDNPELHRLTEQSGTISGLAWDGYDRNVYWTEEDTGIIWRLSRESETAQVFLEGLNKPRDILILPHERLLYWISDRNGSTIESSNLDGSNHQVVLDSDDLVDPKSLSYDPYKKKIYFLDTLQTGFIYVLSCKLDGSNLYYFLSFYKRLEKLEIYKGHLLVTSKDDAQGTLIMSYSVDSGTDTTSGVFPGAGNISAIKVFDENFRQNETGPCFNLNGECEQICISNGKSRICECTFGFKLGRNDKTCTSDPIKDNFMLVIDSTHNNIYQFSLMDESVQGIKAYETKSMMGVTYSPVHNLVIWGTGESNISIIQLNGTGKNIFPMAISDDSYQYLNQFAVDYSTGNIYYTAVKSVSYYSRFTSYIGVLSPNGMHRVLVTNLGHPHGLVVYPSKGLLFYTENSYKPHLGQANMDGSQTSVILKIDNGWPTKLTIDYRNDYLYWIETWYNGIKYCKLDGTDHKTLAEYPGTYLNDLALYQDYLFIATEHSMRKMKISNPNETTEFAAYGELGTIQSISIYSSTFQNKNAFCSMGNGGCSAFCFPTPGGGICGCEDGVDLMEGSDKFCSNIPRCPQILNQIIVSTNCLRVNGSKCTFTCKRGYKVKQGVDEVLCNSTIYTPATPCEEIKCPATLANGKWVNCNFSVEKTCQYTCDYGYTRNNAVTEVECQINGNWKLVNTDNLCIAVTCPEQFSQGKILSTCERRVDERCEYECTGYGYKKNEHISTIGCTELGTWNRDTGSLCQQIHCPKEIPNGALSNGSNGQMCPTAVGTRCVFECNSGFVKEATVHSLHCLLEGWAEDLQTLCTVPSAVSSAHHSDAHLVAIGAGVTISVIVVIVIILVMMKRRKKLNSSFAVKRMEEEVLSGPDMLMNTSFGPEAVVRVTYKNGVVDMTGPSMREEPTKLSLSPENTRRENSLKYDSTMAIPRPHAKDNVRNKMP